MAVIKPFKGVRPPKDLVKNVASRPYDVLSSAEAREEAKGNKYSLLHIVKPEIDLPETINEYDDAVYIKAKENYEQFKKNGWLVQDTTECLYIYAQTMNGKTQHGIVACAAVEDYMNNVIKKHELTRNDKEEDRMKNVRMTSANIEPVFFAYHHVKELDILIAQFVTQNTAEYDFITDDDIKHSFWVIKDENIINKIVSIFSNLPATYVADGHHRTAAAALVGNELKKNNTAHNGNEEYNYFLAVHFPDNQLTIIDYNRVIKDLNGMAEDEFLTKLKEKFHVTEKEDVYKPERIHNFSMYLNKKWYSLTAKENTFDKTNPVGVLDVTILSDLILAPLLNIKNLRTDNRIEFVGGIRGLGELKKRVDSGEMKLAFALYPVSMQQLINIANTNNIMPPKTTWFEPKLRSGLVIHELK